MKTAVFLVKNGIGYGHLRRALLLADRVREAGQLRPIVISQASSLDLLRTTTVPVLNLPLLHRVPSAVGEDCYLEILDDVLARLEPAVVVEDTYPDERYGALAALHGVPRLLVARRLDGLSFDQLRKRGAFARYERILLAQDQEALALEGHSGNSLAAIHFSDLVQAVGNIHCIPDRGAVAQLRARQQGTPLVVVNAGAGGDQLADGFGDRLFQACYQIAERFLSVGHPARFVLVTGPYYAGTDLPETPNTTVQRFTPELSALLAAADVAVIKPGNNVLSEALQGSANLVLVPDASFMEGVDDHARRIAEQYGGTVTAPDRGQLEPAIRQALTLPPRQRRPDAPDQAVKEVVAAIHEHAGERAPSVAAKQLALILRLPAGVQLDQHGPFRYVATLDDSDATAVGRLSRAGIAQTCPSTLLADGPPSGGTTPQHIVDHGARLLLSAGPELDPAVRRWLELDPPRPSLLSATLMTARPRSPRLIAGCRLLARLLDNATITAALLDLTALTGKEARDYLVGLSAWLAQQPVSVASPDDLLRIHATRLLRGDR